MITQKMLLYFSTQKVSDCLQRGNNIVRVKDWELMSDYMIRRGGNKDWITKIKANCNHSLYTISNKMLYDFYSISHTRVAKRLNFQVIFLTYEFWMSPYIFWPLELFYHILYATHYFYKIDGFLLILIWCYIYNIVQLKYHCVCKTFSFQIYLSLHQWKYWKY